VPQQVTVTRAMLGRTSMPAETDARGRKAQPRIAGTAIKKQPSDALAESLLQTVTFACGSSPIKCPYKSEPPRARPQLLHVAITAPPAHRCTRAHHRRLALPRRLLTYAVCWLFSDGAPGLITPPPPHEAAASSAPAARARRRSPLQRFRCKFVQNRTLTNKSGSSTTPPTRASLRARQVPRAPPARSPWPEARCHHILAPPSLQPHAPRLHSTPSPPATRSPASACTRLQIAGSATVILCSPASSQATLAPLLLQFSLRAILVCVSTHPRRHPHTLHLASLCSPFIHIPDPHPLPPTFHA
jgi:hypothetical protein